MSKQLTAKAPQGVTYEAFIAQGWTDALLTQHGYLAPAANESRAPPLTLVETQRALTAAVKALEESRHQPLEGPFKAAQAEYERAHKAHWDLQRATGVEKIAAMRVPPIDWSALHGDPPARTWLIPEWLGISPTLMSGRGGMGKTRIMQATATSLATAKQYLGEVAQPHTVLMWSCEDTLNDVWLQQHAINQHLGVEMAQLGRLHVVPRYGHENTLLYLERANPAFTPLIERLREEVNDLKADVLILDNIAQLFGGNENDRHHATMFVNGIAGLVKDRPFTPILLGHTARSEGSEYSGNAAWENAVRMRWYLGPKLPEEKLEKDEEPDPNTVILARRKANHSNKDWLRFNFANGLFVPEGAGSRVFAQADRNQSAERTVLAAIPRLQEAGVRVIDANNSPDYLPEHVSDKGLANGHTKKELAGAMNRLLMTGQIKKVIVGVYAANRSPKEGLVVSGA